MEGSITSWTYSYLVWIRRRTRLSPRKLKSSIRPTPVLHTWAGYDVIRVFC